MSVHDTVIFYFALNVMLNLELLLVGSEEM